MNINWFPGHMKKALDQIRQRLPQIDLCCEILDSRIPLSSSNQLLEQVTKQKKRLIVLNKKDMADPSVTAQWLFHFEKQGIRALALDAAKENAAKKVRILAEEILKEEFRRKEEKGIQNPEIRMLVFGIPNSGKSTFINMMSKKRSAKVGDRPGVTTGQQWIHARESFLLMDTPGILWHKLDPDQALHLAFTGAIRDEVLQPAELGLRFLENMLLIRPKDFSDRYQIQSDETALEIMERMAKQSGCLLRGGEIDYDRIGKKILDDFRKQRFGRISLERP
ncbi:MAG: ribosome biogenesis GTPase YlqF [Peptoniphilaceae bacterium]|nr:ribosome biogenesis GTPase YlqF [Peptoniphilaceae bacterium]MDY5766473.1 ribosome biogenesis GTPase YlqF [Peptoniphilaceae bacterium]